MEANYNTIKYEAKKYCECCGVYPLESFESLVKEGHENVFYFIEMLGKMTFLNHPLAHSN